MDKLITKVSTQKNKNRKEGYRGGSKYTPPLTTLHKLHTCTHQSSPYLSGGAEASCTQCQPFWNQANPTGPFGSYSGVGCWGWLVPLCNSSSVSDTVQVCPLWPRLPGDCVNSTANLRKYRASIFVKPVSASLCSEHTNNQCNSFGISFGKPLHKCYATDSRGGNLKNVFSAKKRKEKENNNKTAVLP